MIGIGLGGALVCAALGVAAARPARLGRRRGPLMYRTGHRKSGGWATGKDLRGVTSGQRLGPGLGRHKHRAPVQRGRLVLGSAGRRLVVAERGHSVLVVGPTQSGKTTGLAIPAILEWEGPVVAVSVKTDLMRHTVNWRSRQGGVWIYDPTAAAGDVANALRGSVARWSPLDSSSTWHGARRMAASLTEVARLSGGSLSDADFWYSMANKLLAPLLLAAAVGRGDMGWVVGWLDEQEVDEVSSLLDLAGELDALRAVRAIWTLDERQKGSVYTTAGTVIEAFSDPSVKEASMAGGDRIDAGRLLDGSATLYICAPAHDQRRLRPVLATLVAQVIEAAYERAGRSGCPLDPPLLVVLDEAANIAPLAELDGLASTAAGHGVQLITVWQDLAQIQARYGPRGSTVINNHRAKVFLSGISDPGTLEHASRLLGEVEQKVTSSTFEARAGNQSTTESVSYRPLLAPDALRRIEPGTGVCIMGHLPPIRLSLRPWMSDPELRSRAEAPQQLVRRSWRTYRIGASVLN